MSRCSQTTSRIKLIELSEMLRCSLIAPLNQYPCERLLTREYTTLPARWEEPNQRWPVETAHEQPRESSGLLVMISCRWRETTRALLCYRHDCFRPYRSHVALFGDGDASRNSLHTGLLRHACLFQQANRAVGRLFSDHPNSEVSIWAYRGAIRYYLAVPVRPKISSRFA